MKLNVKLTNKIGNENGTVLIEKSCKVKKNRLYEFTYGSLELLITIEDED